MDDPQFAAALATDVDTDAAEAALVEGLAARLGGTRPDLLVAFATPHHATRFEGLTDRLSERTGASVVLGCTAESVVGPTREVEQAPGLAILAATLPDTELIPFHAHAVEDADDVCFAGIPPVDGIGRAGAIVLGDPFSLPVHDLLETLGQAAPELAVVGGLASGGGRPGSNQLFDTSGVREEGCVGVILRGATELTPVVSQGCRPIGEPWVITDARENVIRQLGGRPAFEALTETMRAASPADRQLLQQAPFIGLAVDPTKSRFQRGDFLVRGLMGVHPQDHSIVVGDLVRRGQTVQFLARDAATAGEDLEHLLRQSADRAARPDAPGALMFTCNGRGQRMFGEPDHDLSHLRRVLGADTQVAGFFAGGEIGPVGGRNHLHGFTASIALFSRSDS